MRAPGGGRKAKIYNTVAARLLSAFYQENKGRTLSVALMQEILNLMRTAHIVPTDVPKTVYHLVESGKLFLPKKVCLLPSLQSSQLQVGTNKAHPLDRRSLLLSPRNNCTRNPKISQ